MAITELRYAMAVAPTNAMAVLAVDAAVLDNGRTSMWNSSTRRSPGLPDRYGDGSVRFRRFGDCREFFVRWGAEVVALGCEELWDRNKSQSGRTWNMSTCTTSTSEHNPHLRIELLKVLPNRTQFPTHTFWPTFWNETSLIIQLHLTSH